MIPAIRPRKGHKKSRAGCFNCKTRKIKCQENRPSCHNCIRRIEKCVYPNAKTSSALAAARTHSPDLVPRMSMQSTPTLFTMTDLRLFQHYLQEAYPHLPVSNDKTWLSQVPLIAHQHEYLMHAILGMAASHLGILTGENLQSAAIHHRLLAIQGFNNAISKKIQTASAGDAALGCAYLLTFQSTYMNDGVSEFFQFVRGCHLLSDQILAEKLSTAFLVGGRDHFVEMESRLMDLPGINIDILAGAAMSLEEIRQVLDQPCHFAFHGLLVHCIDEAKVSSSDVSGYFAFIAIYQKAPKMDANQFRDLLDTSNHICRVLIAHFFTIQTILLPILTREWSNRKRSTPAQINLNWIFSISDSLPKDLQKYCVWPRAIAEAVQEELSHTQPPVPKVSILRKREGHSQDIILGRLDQPHGNSRIVIP
ncbi:uncharacterized protein LY89DRAFT_595727 [Mollisia scopiformis]|uniref:Zn(2)-C6 fungal-type domain-containing protein n=1 Tax=Mollisia scopiformis TaxID=149040 RepID=A0A194WSZ3_MOLSC|nr:uncharacterized protein LY89DRAFT_595727 [Mollisia scopiformis]KUJ10794.1 hypothetical protein LY89DRAFT_595727 [Mollisia scopiformis]